MVQWGKALSVFSEVHFLTSIFLNNWRASGERMHKYFAFYHHVAVQNGQGYNWTEVVLPD